MNINVIFSGVWAIQESALAMYVDLAERGWTDNSQRSDERQLAAMEAAAVGHASRRPGNVAVIPIHGPISQKSSMFQEFFGGCSTEGIAAAVENAVADTATKAIVLDIDSPGGSVYGVEQAADAIRVARGKKPIVSIANSLSASAAYWIGAQADEFYVAPGAEVGSVGVFCMHADYSAALAQDGVKVTFIKAGKYKVDGNPYEPLSDDARADAQASVDRYYGDFVKALAAGRGVSAATVKEKFGEGRVFGGDEAVSRGMADRVGTLADVIGRLGGGKTTQGRRATMLRRRFELRRMP